MPSMLFLLFGPEAKSWLLGRTVSAAGMDSAEGAATAEGVAAAIMTIVNPSAIVATQII